MSSFVWKLFYLTHNAYNSRISSEYWQRGGLVWHKNWGRMGCPHKHSSCRKTRCIDLS